MQQSLLELMKLRLNPVVGAGRDRKGHPFGRVIGWCRFQARAKEQPVAIMGAGNRVHGASGVIRFLVFSFGFLYPRFPHRPTGDVGILLSWEQSQQNSLCLLLGVEDTFEAGLSRGERGLLVFAGGATFGQRILDLRYRRTGI